MIQIGSHEGLRCLTARLPVFRPQQERVPRLRQLDLFPGLVAHPAKHQVGIVECREGVGWCAGYVGALGKNLLDLSRAHVRPAARQIVEHVLEWSEKWI